MDGNCGDNRFEIIAKAKKYLLENTNIETSKDEMKVLDNFLFRLWQCGWLKQFDDSKEPYYIIDEERLLNFIDKYSKNITLNLSNSNKLYSNIQFYDPDWKDYNFE